MLNKDEYYSRSLSSIYMLVVVT